MTLRSPFEILGIDPMFNVLLIGVGLGALYVIAVMVLSKGRPGIKLTRLFASISVGILGSMSGMTVAVTYIGSSRYYLSAVLGSIICLLMVNWIFLQDTERR